MAAIDISGPRTQRKLQSDDWESSELMMRYLALPPAQRATVFAGTSTLARRTGISQRTLQTWIEAGLILAVKVGRNYKVYIPSVQTYLRDCNGRDSL